MQGPGRSPLALRETCTGAGEHGSNHIKADPTISRNTSYFVEGWGCDHTKLLAEQWPTTISPASDPRESRVKPRVIQEEIESDPVIRGRPVVLQNKDGHALWVSQKTLDAMAPIPAHVEGGHIVHDEIGNPTGQRISPMGCHLYCG